MSATFRCCATDPYGNFIPRPERLPADRDGSARTGRHGDAGRRMAMALGVRRCPATTDSCTAVRTGHAFLADIAHNAVPDGPRRRRHRDRAREPAATSRRRLRQRAARRALRRRRRPRQREYRPDRRPPRVPFRAQPARRAHQGGGARRCRSDAGRRRIAGRSRGVPERVAGRRRRRPSRPAAAGLVWDGERLFQAAKFGTEMQYQHLVFEEFARKIQPNINVFLVPDGFDVDDRSRRSSPSSPMWSIASATRC